MNWRLVCATAALLALGGAAPRAQADLPALSDRDKRQAADESKQGADISAQIAKTAKFDTDPADVERVNRIGQRLAAVADTTVVPFDPKTHGFGNERVYPFTWHFFIIKDKDVNAFSLPGGYVYVNSGLLKFVRSDDELAGVLGHEITHAAHHHVQALSHEQSKMNTQMAIGMIAAVLAHVPPQDIANLYQGASYSQMGILNNKYSEAAEQDADHGGAIIMSRAGFNPVGMLTFMQRLAEQEQLSPTVELGILRDHPYTSDRVTAITAELHQMDVPITPKEVRMVTGGPKVSVVPGPAATAQILFGGQTLATVADPQGGRAASAAGALNELLDSGLQLYQVKADGSDLVVADRTILTFTPADAALQPGTNPQALASAASAVLRKGIWVQAVKQ